MTKDCVTLLARFWIGVLLLAAGVGKFMMGYQTYLDNMLPGLNEMTLLPWVVGAAFLYVLPVLEVLLGTGVLLGIRTSDALGSAGALLILLSLGSFLAGNYAVAAYNSVYVLIAMFGVYTASEGHNKWALN